MGCRVIALILLLALGLLAAPVAVEAQQKPGKVYRIGWLGTSLHVQVFSKAFLEELRDLGWVEGKHFVVEYRSTTGTLERLPALAAELVDLKVDVILSVLTASTRAAKEVTTTIPIVFTIVADPVGDGLVTSFARPGGNVTGVSNNLVEMTGKVVELLTQAVPGISRVTYLWNAAHGRTAFRVLKEMQGAAQALGVALQSVEVREDKDFEPAFLAVRRGRPDGLIVLGEPLTGKHRARIVDFALTHRLPLMAHGPRQWPEAGALMSYAPVYPAMFRRAAHLVDKILRGTKPADLPVELPTTYDFVVNQNTAKALGLTIPPSVLVRADRVIE